MRVIQITPKHILQTFLGDLVIIICALKLTPLCFNFLFENLETGT